MCNSCEQVRINGIVCHETGCPDSWKDRTHECKCCDKTFKPKYQGQKLCMKKSCHEEWNGISITPDQWREFKQRI